MTTHRSRLAAIAAALAVAGAQAGAAPGAGPDTIVIAQKADAPGAVGAEAGPDAIVAGEAGEAWSVQCLDSARTLCRVFQNMVVPDTGERLLTVLVEPQASDVPLRMALALPHGLYLPAGVEIRIDGGEPITAEIATSDADGAYASLDADSELIAAMKSGETMTISFRAATQQGFTVPVSLDGFAAAMGALR